MCVWIWVSGLAMLAASLFIGLSTEASVRRLAWRAILLLVGAAAGSAAWFFILQKWVIGAFCPYCMVTHIIGLLVAGLAIWQAPRQFDADSFDVAQKDSVPATPRRAIRLLPAIGVASLGLVLSGIMAACQVAFPPPPAYSGGESQEILPAIDPHAAPLVGSPDAAYVVALFFDYQCSHCQQLHLMLDEVTRRYGGKLAFALCPTPLNPRCNPYILRDVDEFKDSCELAKVALAVWVADREAFALFETWMFSFESGDRWHPRRLDSAWAKAVELVGETKFGAALADPWIERYLRDSIRIYGGTIQNDNNAVPRLVFGSRWVIPQPYDAEDLFLILHDSLALPKP